MSISFQYLKFHFLGVRGIENQNGFPDLQFADINIYNGSERVDYSSASASSSWDNGKNGGTFSDGLASYGIDNDYYTKFGARLNGNNIANGNYSNGQFTITRTSTYTINFGQQLTATKYNYTTGFDEPSRDPVSWNLYASNDGVNYRLVDNQNVASITTTRNVSTQDFTFNDVYLCGTSPSITSAIQISSTQARFYFNPSTGGIPSSPISYYYSLDGENHETIGTDVSSVLISNLSSGVRSVVIIAKTTDLESTVVWYSSSSEYSVTMYVAGNAPVITSAVLNSSNELPVKFNPSTGGYPSSQISYYYSLDGGNFELIGTDVSSVTIYNVSNAQHAVVIQAKYINGQTVVWTVNSNVYNSSVINQLLFRYLKFEFLKLRSTDSAGWLQFNSINVNNNGVNVTYSNSNVTWIGGPIYPDANMFSAQLLGGVNGSGNVNSPKSNAYIIDFGSEKVATGYTYITNYEANVYDPVSWNIYASMDGINYLLTDTKINVTIPNERSVSTDNFTFSYSYSYGTKSSITSMVYTGPNNLTVSYSRSIDGNPSPTYYYAVDDSGSLVKIGDGTYSSTIDISNVSFNVPRTIYLFANGLDASLNVIWSRFDSSFSIPPTLTTKTFKYLKFAFYAIRGETVDGIQFQEMTIYNGVNRVDYTSANASWNGGSVYNVAQSPAQGIDASNNTKFGANISGTTTTLANGYKKLNTTETKNLFIINFNKYVSANNYNFVTGDDSPNRDPVSWKLYASNDGIIYKLIDEQTNLTITNNRTSPTQYFAFNVYSSGTIPSITSLLPGINKVTVYYNASTEGNPYPNYYYSVDGSNNPVKVGNGSYSSPIDISGISTGSHSIYMIAKGFDASLNTVWSSYDSSSVTTYYAGERIPSITQITKGLNTLRVYYNDTSGGNPAPTYYYSVDGSTNLIKIGNGSYSSPIDISNLSYESHSVYIIAKGMDASLNAIWSLSDSSYSTPYSIGERTPSITQITKGLNTLRVYYNDTSGGNPAPTYYYSVDNSTNLIKIGNGSYSSPIDISGLSAGSHSIYITAKGFDASLNTIWSLSDSSSATPYSIGGRTPSITQITKGLNTLRVYYNDTSGGYPAPTYYYSVDGSTNPIKIGNGSYSSPIDISGLSYESHSIYIIAQGDDDESNIIWYMYDSSSETPYSVGGRTPSITNITSGINTLSVYYNDTSGGYPAPTYYYSVDGSTNPVKIGDGSYNSPIDISGLSGGSHSIYMIAKGIDPSLNTIWTTYDSSSGVSYATGTTPSITQISKGPNNTATVYYNSSSGGTPSPTYYYSVDGSTNPILIGDYTSPIDISNLTIQMQTIYIIAKGFDSTSNTIWTTSDSSSVSFFTAGTSPSITSVVPGFNSLIVNYNSSTGGEPLPTYYYSVDVSNNLIEIQNQIQQNSVTIPDLSYRKSSTIYIFAVGKDAQSNTLWSSYDASSAIPNAFLLNGSNIETMPTTSRLYYDGVNWVSYLSDSSNNIATSHDGTNWTSSQSNTANNLVINMPSDLYPESNLNLYPTFNYPIYSVPTNIINSVRKYVHNKSDRGFAKIQPLSIACGLGSNSLAYSEDGIMWHAINNTIFNHCNRAIWNGTLWVAVGQGTHWVATSYDGLSWDAQDNTLMTECYDIAWNGSYFVAVGAGSSRMATSTDGMNWTPVSINSIFSVRIHAIEWTGLVWLAYGEGINTTAISSSIDASIWTPTPTPNLCLIDCYNFLNGSLLDSSASSQQGTDIPANAFDGSFNSTITKWSSADSNYDASGNYIGTSVTQGISGEWLQVNLNDSRSCSSYYIVFSIADGSAIPQSWSFLGSTDGSAWTTLDTFNYGTSTPPDNAWKYPFVCLPLAVDSGLVSAYSYYRIVFTKTFGADHVSVSELLLFDGGEQQSTLHIRPIILKDVILHPTRILSVDGAIPNVYRITDLSCNLIRNSVVHNGQYVNNIIYGLTSEPSATAFDGTNHIVLSTNGEAVYLSNTASNTNLNFDNSMNGMLISGVTGATTAACYNCKFVLLGSSYGVLNENSLPVFYANNLSSLFTTINGLASNSGYGFVVSPNKIYLDEDERLSLVTPKFYNNAISPDTSISFNVYNSNK